MTKPKNIPTWSQGELHHAQVFTDRNSAERVLAGCKKNRSEAPRLYPRIVKAGRTELTVWMLVIRKRVAKAEGR
jgi:hypothetical protein